MKKGEKGGGREGKDAECGGEKKREEKSRRWGRNKLTVSKM